ncbi:MAG: HAD family hydrolase [bacterium]|nr:HAD family hydrolase [bacterium]
MKKLVIFDLDGTLINSIEDLGQAANYALSKNGFPTHSLASYPFFVGNGVRNLIRKALPEENRNDTTIDSLLKDFKEYYDDHNVDSTKPYDGIMELLKQLQEQDVKLAVASNKYQKATEKIVSQLFPDIKFVSVQGQQDGVNVKPDPSIVFNILGVALVPKAEVLYVGDSGVDMETARRACVDSVGVTWGFRSEKELNEYHADRIVHRASDIFDIVMDVK